MVYITKKYQNLHRYTKGVHCPTKKILCYIKNMAYTKKYMDENRDSINLRRREAYAPRDRKMEYQKNRVCILEKQKKDRAVCPLCQLSFRRLYIPTHIETRHNRSS